MPTQADKSLIVFVDESGDHGLDNANPDYPVFVLSFCIFEVATYTDFVIPALARFKFKHFGHDLVILHEHEIRKAEGEFKFLVNATKRAHFMTDLTGLMRDTPFTVIAAVINKLHLRKQYANPENPYHLAIQFGLERIHHLLLSQGQTSSEVPVVIERRGKKEDAELELEFRRVCDGGNFKNLALPFRAIFAHKLANSAGLQLADLTARPIGLSILRPGQPNRAFDILREKLYKGTGDRTGGWGIKCFP